MVVEFFTLVGLALGSAFTAELNDATRAWRAIETGSSAALTRSAAFEAAARSVSNWRLEAALGLDAPAQSLARLVAADPPATPRCIKLNNYWCVKRAGWAGEIAADAEGHVAFASALEGAVVAAMLLRRYYLVYRRRSAQAILSHWAPAQCGGIGGGSGRARGATGSAYLGAIAPHGIGNTLRARWLASHRPGFALAVKPAKAAGGPVQRLRRSVVAGRSLKMMAAPEIAVGMGERNALSEPIRLASLETSNLAPLLDGPSCSDESARVHNYALRVIEGVAAGPDEDLRLFAEDGSAGPNLARVMLNMAKVEIGPFAAQGALVAEAIEAEERRERGRGAALAPQRRE